MNEESPVILALYPNSVGIGYVCLQIPEKLLGYGVATAKPLSNSRLLKRTEKFIGYYRPKIIVLRETGASKTSLRSDKLIEAITTLSGEMGIKVFRYTKQQIKDTFEVFGAHTKYEMVSKIITMLPDLASRAPKEKKWYEKEDYNMALFDAVSLAVTHAHLSEEY
jgi:Holliday junction resolvasome RuvABC endonuclease subunit